MDKRCNTCGRVVQETIHTSTTWKVDYYETAKQDQRLIVCVDCKYGTTKAKRVSAS